MTATTPLQDTQAWLEKAVIGLNLCPFAKAVHAKGQIRWVQSAAEQPLALLKELVAELKLLSEADPEVVDTTLLVHPLVLQDFEDFNDFLGVVEDALTDLGLDDRFTVCGVGDVLEHRPDYRHQQGWGFALAEMAKLGLADTVYLGAGAYDQTPRFRDLLVPLTAQQCLDLMVTR